jgi:sialate O-acetylesterase
MCCATVAAAQVKPSALFSDHMVLQSGMSVPIWGTAGPAEKITIKFNSQTRHATADTTGKWMVRLTKLKPGGPWNASIFNIARSRVFVRNFLTGYLLH